MMRADVFNSHVYPVRKEITGTQQIQISHVCDLDKSKPKRIISNEKLLQGCYTDNIESEIVIANEGSTEESKSESVQKSINTNKEKYAIYETEDE